MTTVLPYFLLFIALAIFAWVFLVAWLGYRQKVYAFKQSLIPAQNSKLGGSSMVAKLVFQDLAECFRYSWGFSKIMQYFQSYYTPLLVRAGNPALLVGDEYFLIKVLGSLMGMIVMAVTGMTHSLPGLLLLGMCLFLLPDYLLKKRAKRYLDQARFSTPEALENIAFMLKHGVRSREALRLYVGSKSWTPLQALLHPYISQGQGMPLFKPLLKQLAFNEFVRMGAVVDQLEEEPSQMAEALTALAAKIRTRLTKRTEDQSQKLFITTVFCFFFFIIPSIGIILFAPIVIDSYSTFINVFLIR